VRLDPKFALAWALLSYVDARGYRTQSLQPTVALREEARQAAETALTLQPNLGEAVLAKGYYHYACLKDYDTAVRYFEQARQLLPNSSRIPESLAYVARRRGQWDRSESYFNEAERLDPRNVNLLTQHALSYIALRRFPKRCESLIRFSISRRTTWIRLVERRLSHKPRATCRGLRRSSLRSTRRPTTRRRWKHKFTKRSWSAALHKSSLG
jgi:tetratricopeptide (TPR) repeat protein